MHWVVIAVVILILVGRHDYQARKKRQEEEDRVKAAIDLAVKLERDKWERENGTGKHSPNTARYRARKNKTFGNFSKT